MRLSDLLGAHVTDATGRTIGRVRDVRLVQDGPMQGTFGAGLRLQGLVVGRWGVASRLGYQRADTNAPWLLDRLAARLSRDVVYVPWSEVVEVHHHRITLACAADSLSPPTPLHDVRAPS